MTLLDDLRVLVDYFEEEDLCADLERLLLVPRELQDYLNLLVDGGLALEAQVLRNFIKESLVALVNVVEVDCWGIGAALLFSLFW